MLSTIWFVLIGVLFAGYAIFDGFDIGAGILYPFICKNQEEKQVVRAAVGPVWDGNEVWLITAGGALFAAFPAVYATVFSGFYLALMLVLFALIARAAALEFHHSDPKWTKLWDGAFFLGSAVPGLLFGVAAGNIIRGVPLTVAGEFGGNFFTLLNPFSLVCGLVGLAWFILQGSSWLALKSPGDLASRSRTTRKWSAIAVIALIAVGCLAAAIFIPDVLQVALKRPLSWAGAAILLGGVVVALVGRGEKADLRSFLASSISALGLVLIWAASIFPALVPSLGPGEALTITNASSSNLTLTVMLVITGIGLPFVFLYIFLIYRAFRGRIEQPKAGEQIY